MTFKIISPSLTRTTREHLPERLGAQVKNRIPQITLNGVANWSYFLHLFVIKPLFQD